MNSRLDENYDFSYLVPSTYQDIEEYVESKDFKEILRSILDSNILTTREFEVLKYRMGFYSDKIYTFEEIGQIKKIRVIYLATFSVNIKYVFNRCLTLNLSSQTDSKKAVLKGKRTTE